MDLLRITTQIYLVGYSMIVGINIFCCGDSCTTEIESRHHSGDAGAGRLHLLLGSILCNRLKLTARDYLLKDFSLIEKCL